MAWVYWLTAPLVLPVLVALWVWWRGRPAKPLSTDDALRAHAAYLDALALPARSRDAGPYAPHSAPPPAPPASSPSASRTPAPGSSPGPWPDA